VTAKVTVTDAREPVSIHWQHTTDLPSRTYTCGYCGDRVGPDRGCFAVVQQGVVNLGHITIIICSSCRQPTYFDRAGAQHPGVTLA
jgi:hypothetical protein